MLLTNTNAAEHAGGVFGVGFNAAELINLKAVCIEQAFYLVVKTCFFNASAAVGKKYSFAVLFKLTRQRLYTSLTEYELGRGTIIKILHGFSAFLLKLNLPL